MNIENRYIESSRQFPKERLSHFEPSDLKKTKMYKGKEYIVVGTIEEKYHPLKRIIIGIVTLCRMIFSKGGKQNVEVWECIKKGYRPVNLFANSPQLSLELTSAIMGTQGLINLALKYCKEKDIDKVFTYLDQAIKEKSENAAFLKAQISVKEKGDAESYAELARVYRDGIGVEKDINQAQQYFVKAEGIRQEAARKERALELEEAHTKRLRAEAEAQILAENEKISS